MRINLDEQNIINLKNVLFDKYNFFYLKTYDFNIPGKKKGSSKVNLYARDCVMSSISRIEELIWYLNSLDIEVSREGTFSLCNLLNFGETLIECISMIGSIYNCHYEKSGDISSFHQKGINNEGNDEEYFKYIRSLCSVHPIKTNFHPIYQGNQNEWCPYIDYKKDVISEIKGLKDNSIDDADFVLTIYVNEKIHPKYLPIKIKEIFSYITKRYNFINNIIDAINIYNKKKVLELQNTHIKKPDEFDNYYDYLINLSDEIYLRFGSQDYIAREWASMFKTKFDDEVMQRLFEKYKSFLKVKIESFHNALQDMSCLDENFSFDLFDFDIDENMDYSYEFEKFTYLYPSEYIEVVEDNKDINLSFIDKKNNFDYNSFDELFKILNKAILNKFSSEQLLDLSRKLDVIHNEMNKVSIPQPIWARLMLKIAEPVFNNVIKFDYLSNDWHLYLQIEIAKWLVEKKGEEDERKKS